MHFLLALLGLVLDRLFPAWRDGITGDSLTMAARADGRLEHIPIRPGLWDRCLSWLVSFEARPREAKKPRPRRAPARQPSPGDSP
jgi:hypothetical protein